MNFQKYLKFVTKHLVWFIAAIAVIASLSATIYYFHQGHILAYNDARSHLDIARRVIDNQTPGVTQFGGTWLPLPQLLMLPFVANHTLWHTGLAGSIVSMTAYVIATILLFKILLLITKHPLSSTLGALIFAFNPNILYMQSTPMTELTLLATMLFGSYYFIKWLYNQKTEDLLIAGFGVFLSTLVRYEGWFVLIVCSFIIVFNSLVFTKKYRKGEGQAILFSSLGFLGIALWMLWNLVIWGKPLYFLNGEASAKAQQDHLAAIGQLPTKHDLLLSTSTTLQSVIMNVGKIAAIIALISLLIVLVKKIKDRNLLYALLILIAPVLLDLTTLFLGISTVRNSWSNMFNIRYGTMGVPFVAVVIALAYDVVKIPKLVKAPLLLVLVFISFNAFIVTLYDPVHGSSGDSPSVEALRSAITHNYKGGKILASVQTFDPVMNELGYPLKNYTHEGNYRIWNKTLKQPQQTVGYILYKKSKGAEIDAVYKNYLKRQAVYDKYYRIVYDKNDYVFMELKSMATSRPGLKS